MDHGMHDTMMSLLLILAILVLGLYFTLILVFDKSRVSLCATPLTVGVHNRGLIPCLHAPRPQNHIVVA